MRKLLLMLALAGLSCAQPAQSYAESYATPLLNDSFTPGLPHLTALKHKKSLSGFGGYARQSGKSSIGDPDQTDMTASYGNGWVDANYTPNWNWWINFNAGGGRSQLKDVETGVVVKKVDAGQAEISWASHVNMVLLYGVGIQKYLATETYKDTTGDVIDKREIDGTLATLSAGLKLGDITLGAGATLQQYQAKDELQLPTKKKITYSYGYVTPKFGLGYNKGNILDGKFQLDFSMATTPSYSLKKIDAKYGAARQSNYSFEYQRMYGLLGIYWQGTEYGPSTGDLGRSVSTVKISFAYTVPRGNAITVVIYNQTEDTKRSGQDLPVPTPDYTEKIEGAGFMLGYSFGFY